MAKPLAAFLLLLSIWAAAATAQVDYPPLTGRVVDQAGVLPPAAEAALDERLAAHERATSNQFVVATVSSLDGRDIESYANGLFRAWALGQEEWDNGVLLLVAPNDRQVRIEVGYGLEGVLTDALASRIIRHEILPAFRAGDLPAGIVAGADAILAAIDGAYEPPPEEPEAEDYLPVLFFLLWAAFVFYQSRRRRRRRRVFGRPVGRRAYPVYWGGGRSGGFGGGFGGGGGSSGGGGASGRW